MRNLLAKVPGTTRVKMLGLQLLTGALMVAAHFGFRCPAQGCPACRMVGH